MCIYHVLNTALVLFTIGKEFNLLDAENVGDASINQNEVFKAVVIRLKREKFVLSYSKLKMYLEQTIKRLKLEEIKERQILAGSKKDVANLLTAGKNHKAILQVEQIIHRNNLAETLELLEEYCRQLLQNFIILETEQKVNTILEEAIASLIWASQYLQTLIHELKSVSDQLTAKYGKDFAGACKTNKLNNVNEKVMHHLGNYSPSKILIKRYLMEIAKTYNVSFEADQSATTDDEIPMADLGYLVINLENKMRRKQS